ncbi:MAG: undecaprenyldiphospho-muramoylpentapeptide beta-N-acetylglucosaminyltransferase [Treponema sp.]|jgi:UDP-N-acetylglucosamine--N-acetylmuramyl-(pentapeptide) pyrophosphoryl-undecaprenol N-acetylglucosamine transferase|nr:undecaprenyldiphospho-muramoylpentapeptide beta-N-acetylglucosaminyltransferase [Treponema sp.]
MVAIGFTGGGTGGHIYPGLAVIARIRELPGGEERRIFWIGSDRGMDRAVVEGAGVKFYGIPSGKLRRYASFKNFTDLFRIAAGFFAARRILKREKPALLFSKGGFVSVPPCAAAASLGIPLFSHESDYSPGLATRLNSRLAEKVFIPYNETCLFFTEARRKKLELSGNPIRPLFWEARAAKGRTFLGAAPGERILLVLGGSQGSREINALVEKSLPGLLEDYTVVHQTGEQGGEPESRTGEGLPGRYLPYAYIGEELPHVIAAAELIFCRSGAGTIWECGVLGKPMILLPLRGSGTRGDQVENARVFREAGAALVAEPRPEELIRLVRELSGNEEKRKAMAEGAARITGLDGARIIAEAILRRIEK